MTEDKIISELESEIKRAEYVDRDYVDDVDVDLLSSALELIKRQKETADAVPVKHGVWVFKRRTKLRLTGVARTTEEGGAYIVKKST